MSMKMEEDIKRWTAKCLAALVMEITQGKTTVSEASQTIYTTNAIESVNMSLRKISNNRGAFPRD